MPSSCPLYSTGVQTYQPEKVCKDGASLEYQLGRTPLVSLRNPHMSRNARSGYALGVDRLSVAGPYVALPWCLLRRRGGEHGEQH